MLARTLSPKVPKAGRKALLAVRRHDPERQADTVPAASERIPLEQLARLNLQYPTEGVQGGHVQALHWPVRSFSNVVSLKKSHQLGRLTIRIAAPVHSVRPSLI
jgi:hypothetical protein